MKHTQVLRSGRTIAAAVFIVLGIGIWGCTQAGPSSVTTASTPSTAAATNVSAPAADTPLIERGRK